MAFSYAMVKVPATRVTTWLQISAAPTLDMLSIPPSDRLEKLKGDRAGFWSLRINDQWHIVSRWQSSESFFNITSHRLSISIHVDL